MQSVWEKRKNAARLPFPPLFGTVGHTRVLAVLSVVGSLTYIEMARVLYDDEGWFTRKVQANELRTVTRALVEIGVVAVGDRPEHVSLNAAHPAVKQIRALGALLFERYLRARSWPIPRRALKGPWCFVQTGNAKMFGLRAKHETLLIVAAAGSKGITPGEITDLTQVPRCSVLWALDSWESLNVVRSATTPRRRPRLPTRTLTLDPTHFAHAEMKALLLRWVQSVQPEYLTLAKLIGRVPRRRRAS